MVAKVRADPFDIEAVPPRVRERLHDSGVFETVDWVQSLGRDVLIEHMKSKGVKPAGLSRWAVGVLLTVATLSGGAFYAHERRIAGMEVEQARNDEAHKAILQSLRRIERNLRTDPGAP